MTEVSSDYSLLDNPAWHALQTEHRTLGITDEVAARAARYQSHVSIFAGIEAPSDLEGLAQLATPGEILVLVHPSNETLSPGGRWQELARVGMHQMVCQSPGFDVVDPIGRELGAADESRMLALTELTDPGPFKKGTRLMGRYRGVDGAQEFLAAMAGERFRMPGWVEISGVCSHPDARGRGYAGKLVATLAQGVFDRGAKPFLHVRQGSPSEQSALSIYEKLGFEHHQQMMAAVLRRQ